MGRLLDPKIIQDLLARLSIDTKSTEVVLNLFVSVLVIAFIGYQFMTMFVVSKPKHERVVTHKNQKDTTEAECGDELCDVHVHMGNIKMIPYHYASKMSDEATIKASQFFYENMKLRRSIHSFSTRPVSLKVVQNLIKTAGCSPSVNNEQPWTYCVVAAEETRQRIREIVEEDERENNIRRAGGAEWVVDVAQLQYHWTRSYISDAPVLLVVCHQIFKEEEGNKKLRMLRENELSTSISIGILIAAIQNIGMSTVVTSPLNCGDKISRLLKRPENECVHLLLPLGFAADDATVPLLKRKPVEQITKLY